MDGDWSVHVRIWEPGEHLLHADFASLTNWDIDDRTWDSEDSPMLSNGAMFWLDQKAMVFRKRLGYRRYEDQGLDVIDLPGDGYRAFIYPTGLLDIFDVTGDEERFIVRGEFMKYFAECRYDDSCYDGVPWRTNIDLREFAIGDERRWVGDLHMLFTWAGHTHLR
jgi:hypothetical protein